jgi:hypothetical protein
MAVFVHVYLYFIMYTVTCPLRASIADPGDTAVPKERLGKHSSAVTYSRNNRRIEVRPTTIELTAVSE